MAAAHLRLMDPDVTSKAPAMRERRDERTVEEEETSFIARLAQMMEDTTSALYCVQRTREFGEAQECAGRAAELLAQGRVLLHNLASDLKEAEVSATVTADDLSEFQDQVRRNGLPAGWLVQDPQDPTMRSKLLEEVLELTARSVLGLPSVLTDRRNQKDLQLEIEALTRFSQGQE